MTEIEATQHVTRGEAAGYLRKFADQLDGGDADSLAARFRGADRSSTDASPTDASPTGRSHGDTLPTDTSTRGTTADPSTTTQTASEHATAGGQGTPSGRDSGPTGSDRVGDRRVTFIVGNDSATVNPPNEIEFAVEVGTDDPLVTSETREFVSFELRWDAADVEESDTIDIE